MKFQPTALDGVFIVTLEQRGDDRGFFARLFCRDEFAAQGLDASVAQANNAFSREAGTLRGLHYQVAPAGEAKLVRCIAGRAFDAVVDLRANSPTFRRWVGAELSAANRQMMYAPKGCAHGYLTLEPDTELLYLASAPYGGASERVLRWDDPAIGIEWPMQPVFLSDKDRNAPDFSDSHHRSGY